MYIKNLFYSLTKKASLTMLFNNIQYDSFYFYRILFISIFLRKLYSSRNDKYKIKYSWPILSIVFHPIEFFINELIIFIWDCQDFVRFP